MVLCGMLKRLYTHVFQTEPPTALSSRFYEYINCSGDIFGNGDWEEKSLMEITLVPVSFHSWCYKALILQIYSQNHDPILIWKATSQNEPLVQLTLLLLSFVCNSAGTEWFFSVMGSVKTKSHSRISVSKLKKAATVKLGIWSHQATEGTAQKWLKCEFGLVPSTKDINSTGNRIMDEEDGTNSPNEDQSDGMHHGTSYSSLHIHLLQDLDEAECNILVAIPQTGSTLPQVSVLPYIFLIRIKNIFRCKYLRRGTGYWPTYLITHWTVQCGTSSGSLVKQICGWKWNG
jgi:hypothetical protein